MAVVKCDFILQIGLDHSARLRRQRPPPADVRSVQAFPRGDNIDVIAETHLADGALVEATYLEPSMRILRHNLNHLSL